MVQRETIRNALETQEMRCVLQLYMAQTICHVTGLEVFLMVGGHIKVIRVAKCLTPLGFFFLCYSAERAISLRTFATHDKTCVH